MFDNSVTVGALGLLRTIPAKDVELAKKTGGRKFPAARSCIETDKGQFSLLGGSCLLKPRLNQELQSLRLGKFCHLNFVAFAVIAFEEAVGFIINNELFFFFVPLNDPFVFCVPLKVPPKSGRNSG